VMGRRPLRGQRFEHGKLRHLVVMGNPGHDDRSRPQRARRDCQVWHREHGAIVSQPRCKAGG
jgi:hypothetical protein